jgi:hypothetical protein
MCSGVWRHGWCALVSGGMAGVHGSQALILVGPSDISMEPTGIESSTQAGVVM